jgi:amino acid efflux transporter
MSVFLLMSSIMTLVQASRRGWDETVTTTKQTAPPAASIGLLQGVALYVCAILGAGVLVFPGQAGSLAGPASLIAWGFSVLMGLPLAFTFAALAARFPDAGGVSTFAAKAFGSSAGGVAGWWYFIAGSVGQTIVPLTAGYYVAAGLGIGQAWAPAIAAVVLALALGANLAGLRVGAKVQIGLAAGVAAILIGVIVIAIPQIRIDNFTPFAPHGISGIGRAVVVLFFAFAGWEAIAHLSAEFRDVRRTLPRATLITILIVSTLYLGVSTAVVGTASYGQRALDRVSLGVIIGHGIGISSVTVVAVAAVVICLGTTNAFVASVSRLGYALARDGWAPHVLARQNRHQTPHYAILTVGAIGGAGLAGAALFGWGTDTIVVIPSVLVLATYLLGAAAAARLFTGRLRLLAGITIVLLLITVPFAGWHLLLPPLIAASVIVLQAIRRRR